MTLITPVRLTSWLIFMITSDGMMREVILHAGKESILLVINQCLKNCQEKDRRDQDFVSREQMNCEEILKRPLPMPGRFYTPWAIPSWPGCCCGGRWLNLQNSPTSPRKKMSFQVDWRGHVAVFTMNNPPINQLSAQFRADLAEAI